MNILRKAGGIFLIVISVLGLITLGLLLLNGIIDYYYFNYLMPYKMMLFLFFCFLLFIGLCILGIFLVKKKNISKEQILKNTNIDTDKITNTYNQERYDESYLGKLGKYSYIKNFSIWKYSDDTSSTYKKYNLLYVFIMIFVSFVVICAGSILLINSPYKKWLSLLFVIIVTLFLSAGSRIIGIKSKSMLLAFAYDSINKRLYMFDYYMLSFKYNPNAPKHASSNPSRSFIYYIRNTFETSKTLDYINDNKIIEKIIEMGKMFPYSEELVSVKNLKINSSRIKFKGIFKMGKEEEFKRTVIIPASYENFEELLNILKTMEMYN